MKKLICFLSLFVSISAFANCNVFIDKDRSNVDHRLEKVLKARGFDRVGNIQDADFSAELIKGRTYDAVIPNNRWVTFNLKNMHTGITVSYTSGGEQRFTYPVGKMINKIGQYLPKCGVLNKP